MSCRVVGIIFLLSVATDGSSLQYFEKTQFFFGKCLEIKNFLYLCSRKIKLTYGVMVALLFLVQSV